MGEKVRPEPYEGVTVFWSGIPTGLSPSGVLGRLEELCVREVEYLYIPAPSSKAQQQNKGIGFLHFASKGAAESFAQMVEKSPWGQQFSMRVSLAKYQGPHANLAALMQASARH